DYPGYWQRETEQLSGGYALFAAGALGSHGPVPGESGFKGAERMGKLLANSVMEKLKEVCLTNIVSLGVVGLDVSLPELNVRITDNVRLRPWLSQKLLHLPATGSFLQALRLN